MWNYFEIFKKNAFVTSIFFLLNEVAFVRKERTDVGEERREQMAKRSRKERWK